MFAYSTCLPSDSRWPLVDEEYLLAVRRQQGAIYRSASMRNQISFLPLLFRLLRPLSCLLPWRLLSRCISLRYQSRIRNPDITIRQLHIAFSDFFYGLRILRIRFTYDLYLASKPLLEWLRHKIAIGVKPARKW